MAPKKVTNEDLCKQINAMVATQTRILLIMEGNPEDRHDQGLISDVHENSRFRRASTWLHRSTIAVVLGGMVKILLFSK